MFALEMLDRIMQAGTPSPAVVPSSGGGLQLEWHEKNMDLEIHVLEPYKGEIWWCDRSTGDENTHEITPDLSTLKAPIEKLSAR